jgi:ribonuclease R
LTYTQVAALLENNQVIPEFQGQNKILVPHLFELYALYKALRLSREARGAIDFETVETRVIFGENRKIDQIVPVKRNEAHRLIEECMLVANVATARFLLKSKIPILYRVHAPPSAEKLTDLRKFLSEIGLSLGGGKEPKPIHYANLLQSISSRPDAHLIQTVLLRSLSQAVYTSINEGHFGLAYDAYTHFTSPIRRYPDLLVHRAIRHLLNGGKPNQFIYDVKTIQQFGEHCSFTERRADEATRDVMDWLKCEYMQDHVGKAFDGVITAVTGFGLFIELKDIYVEGLLHVSFLKNDYYRFDPIRHRLNGERTGKSYHLGDSIKVRLVRVDLDDRKIDFELS